MMAISSHPDVATLHPHPLAPLPAMPLVSVLVGNYNYERFIGETMESVLNQTYGNWELIICDDGSTDGSLSVIESYVRRDRRISIIRKPNGGHTSALNTAFAQSRGEIICLLDSDDVYASAKLSMIVGACLANPAAGFLSHRVVRMDERGNRQGVWPLSGSLADGWTAPELLRVGGVLPYAPPTSGISLRREIADSLFPLSTAPPLHVCPDQVITRLAPLITNLKRLRAPLANYRLHNGNTYSEQRVTAESVSKQLEFAQALWKEQRRFLSDMDVELGRQLTRLEENSNVAMMEYLHLRLLHHPGTRQQYEQYLRISSRDSGSKWHWFWRASIYIPDALFEPTVNILLGQNSLKQFLARLKNLA